MHRRWGSYAHYKEEARRHGEEVLPEHELDPYYGMRGLGQEGSGVSPVLLLALAAAGIAVCVICCRRR